MTELKSQWKNLSLSNRIALISVALGLIGIIIPLLSFALSDLELKKRFIPDPTLAPITLLVPTSVPTPIVSPIPTLIPTATPLPIATEAPDETLILVTSFQRLEGNPANGIENEIKTSIRERIDRLGFKNIRIETIAETIKPKDQEQAQAVAEIYNASLIIWGQYSDLKVNIDFLNVKQPSFRSAYLSLEETERTKIANPEEYQHFVLDYAPSQMTFLTLYTIGQSKNAELANKDAIRLLEEAVNALSTTTSSEIDDARVAANFLLGWLRHRSGDLRSAIVSYDEAIRLYPDYSKAYFNRGMAYYKLNEIDKAIADFSEAVTIKQDYIDAYYQRGIAYYYSQRQYEEAIADFNQVIVLDPDDARAYFNRAFIYAYLGNYDAAFDDYDRAIKLDPKHARAYFYRGIALERHSGDFQGAIENYTLAIEAKPDYSLAYYQRILVYARLGECDKAVIDRETYLGFDTKPGSLEPIDDSINACQLMPQK